VTALLDDERTDIDSRLKQSVRRLSEWEWMLPLSTEPAVALRCLQTEARELIELGPTYPQRARSIGRIVVRYYRLIVEAKRLAGPGLTLPSSRKLPKGPMRLCCPMNQRA
jgi:hypothetical protein